MSGSTEYVSTFDFVDDAIPYLSFQFSHTGCAGTYTTGDCKIVQAGWCKSTCR
jgi:hypothetical protein